MTIAIIGYLLVAALVLVVLALGFNALTGRVDRAYDVLERTEIVSVGGVQMSAEELASVYRPRVEQDPSVETPPLLALNYEVIDNDLTYVIVYFQVWEDEIHPNVAVNGLYWLYRAARYGFPVRDIEYLELAVDKTSGLIDRVQFETSPSGDFAIPNSEHIVAVYTRSPSGDYFGEFRSLAGDTLDVSKPSPLPVDSKTARVAIGTWNHLTRPAEDSDIEVAGQADVPLVYLTADEYREAKYPRKSQGTFRTDEPYAVEVVGRVATVGYFVVSGMGLIVFVLSLTRARRRRSH